MSPFENRLEKYAEVAVRVGLNLQPGQTLWVNAPIHAFRLVRLVTRKAYEAGVKDVHIEWNDDEIRLLKYRLAPDEAFEEYPSWRVHALEKNAESNGAYLLIDSTDPALLEGVDPKRIGAFAKTAGAALSKWREYMMADKFTWSILSAPNPAWAKRVFPDKEEGEAVEALWEEIFRACRIDRDDPIAVWEAHNRKLDEKKNYLNARKYRKLHYRAPGTELTVALPDGHVWSGGGARNDRGVPFVPNVPTEEVFTSPLREGTSGVVRSSKPLAYHGNIIDRFELRFENGRIVDFQAEQGYEALKEMLGVDEGARYLGEVALVPHDSPISNANLTFFSTLYDENASNHLAVGQAFAFCLENGKTMSPEEWSRAGLNHSRIHVDFMIGSSEMDIDGERADGSLEPVFRKGNWAF